MSRGIETVQVVEPWLWSVFSGDSALVAMVGGLDSVSGTLAPGELRVPYLHYSLESTRDRLTAQGERIWADCLYLVKAVAATASWDDVAPIAERAHDLIQGAVPDLPGGASLSCHRERIVQYPEVTDGVQYRHAGGIYRVRAYRV